MNDGKLCCSGSPLFLKNSFGTGYRLRVAKLSKFNSNQFINIIGKYIPKTKLISDVETEVIYSFDASKRELFDALPKLFNDIEINKQKYHIESCGLSNTTLEDVFLTVGADVNMSGKRRKKNLFYDSTADEENQTLLLSKQSELISGSVLFINQFFGLLIKRFHFARRFWRMVIAQILIPSAIIALAMLVDNKIRASGKMNTLEMNVKKIYGINTEAFFHGNSKYYSDYSATNSKYGTKTMLIDSLTDVNRWNLQIANSSFTNYIHNHLYGFEVDGDKFKAWFNNEQYHSLPLSIITLYESLLRSIMPFSLRDQVIINVTSVPLFNEERNQDTNQAVIIISWIITCLIFLPLAFPFLAASYILYPIKEQVSKSKLIQLMTGLSPVLFWTANFLFDLFNHLLATGILFLVIYLFDNGMFGKDDQQSGNFLLFSSLILLFL